MSKHWTKHTYVDAQNFWIFIDEESAKLDILSTHQCVETSELCKLMLLGRREMLDNFVTFLSNSEISLRTIVADVHNILSDDEIKRLISEDYGA